jgi:hypothetical protein
LPSWNGPRSAHTTDSAMEPAVFISYSRHDAAEFARRLHCDIVDQGHEVWLDAVDLADGRTWTAEVERALDRTDVVLALLSRGSFLSCHALPIAAGVVQRSPQTHSAATCWRDREPTPVSWLLVKQSDIY